MNDLLQDIAFTWRNSLKKPGTSLLIVITLALGIGVNSAMFSAALQVLVAPLPYTDGDRLVVLEHDSEWSLPTIRDFQSQTGVFEELFYYDQMPYTLLGAGDPAYIDGGVVSWNFFGALGVEPVHGRLFHEAEDAVGAAPGVLLSNRLWRTRFQADPGVIGATVQLNDLTLSVLGVLPDIPPFPDDNDVWITPAGDPYTVLLPSDKEDDRTRTWTTFMLGKLKPGVALAEAEQDLNVVSRRLLDSYPDSYPEDYTVELRFVRELMVAGAGATFMLLGILAALVVLIACANVANLNLSRMAARHQELAIREAMGANPRRINRQVFTESISYALVGGLLGLLIAFPTQQLLSDLAAGYTARADEIDLDATVLLVSFLVALVIGTFSGLTAVFRRRDINSALKEGGDKVTTSIGGMRRRQGLLVIQFALAFVMLASSVLVVLSLYRLNTQDTGFETEGVLAVNLAVNVDLTRRDSIVSQLEGFGRRLLAEAEAMPEVNMAAIVTGAPMLQDSFFHGRQIPYEIEGREYVDPASQPLAIARFASKEYFRLMDIALLAGRPFSDADDENAPHVAIVNESFARRYFPQGNAIGARVRWPNRPQWKTIVGVVGNVRAAGVDQIEEETVYYHFLQSPADSLNLYIRSDANLDQLANRVEEMVYTISPRQSITSIKPLSTIKSDWLLPAALRAILIGLFGILALTVTLSGVIGVISCNISLRLRELGIHMAIGANPRDILSIFLSQGMRLYAWGLGLGVLLMLVLAPSLQPLLYQTSSRDPLFYLVSALVLTATILITMYLCAGRTAGLEPLRALRAE